MTDKPSSPELLPCPFCGARPHSGPGKVKHDQLHGEKHQDFRIWCPHLCAQKAGPDRERAAAEWNRRALAEPEKGEET